MQQAGNCGKEPLLKMATEAEFHSLLPVKTTDPTSIWDKVTSNQTTLLTPENPPYWQHGVAGPNEEVVRLQNMNARAPEEGRLIWEHPSKPNSRTESPMGRAPLACLNPPCRPQDAKAHRNPTHPWEGTATANKNESLA
eukprot:6473353-Amphidinium_carterae.1